MFYLRFTKPVTKPYPLPPGLVRGHIDGPGGKLEFIIAEPPSTYTGPRKRPVFFSHGGFGFAGEWAEWMAYLSQIHNIPCYAVSLRGHGFSWHPSYIRMVFFTTKRTLANDLVAGIKWAENRERSLTDREVEVVLVGHSSGGGLAQIILDAGDVTVTGLVLAASIPCYGSLGVYLNWWTMDIWFSLRSYLHLMHPKSPLSTTKLAKQAFFCPEKPDQEVDEFMSKTSYYESFLWPIGMMFGRLVDVKNVLRRVSGWGTSERLMILAAEKDRLMHVPQMKRAAECYREGVEEMVAQKQLDHDLTVRDKAYGIRFTVVPRAGHHLQNDLQWEAGAKALLDFYDQL